MLSLLNTGLIISEIPLGHPALETAGEFENVPVFRQFLGSAKIPRLLLYRNRDALPRVWLVPGAEVRGNERLDKNLTATDPHQVALVEPGQQRLSGGEPYRPVPIRRYTPNRIELKLETRLPAYLCLSEIWAPGWRAWDNGRLLEVARINGIFRGMLLDPGNHSIQMRYWPTGLMAGMIISAATAIILLLMFIRSRPRQAVIYL
jgi:hypothetical protein